MVSDTSTSAETVIAVQPYLNKPRYLWCRDGVAENINHQHRCESGGRLVVITCAVYNNIDWTWTRGWRQVGRWTMDIVMLLHHQVLNGFLWVLMAASRVYFYLFAELHSLYNSSP